MNTEGAWPESKGRCSLLYVGKFMQRLPWNLNMTLVTDIFVKGRICLSKCTLGAQVGFTWTISVWDAGINCCGFDLYLGNNSENSPPAN